MTPERSYQTDAEARKRRREYVIIAITLIAVALVTYFEVKLSIIARSMPVGNTVLFFALFNLDIVLILLLIFLVTRNLVKLFVDRRKGIMGSSLKTKLVLAFTGLTIIPTGVLFFLALKFINFSLEGWFDPQVSKIFDTSNEIVQTKYEDDAEEVLHFAQALKDYLQDMNLFGEDRRVNLEENLKFKLKEYDLAVAGVFWKDGRRPVIAARVNLPNNPTVTSPPADFLQKAFDGQEGYTITPLPGDTDVIRGIVPLHDPSPDGPVVGALVAQILVDKSLYGQMQRNKQGYEEYINFKNLKNPIKNTHIILLAMTSLLIIFCATWFGIYTAKAIVIPIERLAVATELVAKGDFNVTVEADARDEMGVLAGSFNKMTRQLVTSKVELDRAYGSLERKNIEIDQRRKYMEIVLANVGAGVVSVDRDGHITTVNKAAERMLRINVKDVVGKLFRDVMRPEHQAIVNELIEIMSSRKEGSVKRPVTLTIGGSLAHLQVTLTELRDEDGEPIGLVGIFEDMTQVLQAQKAIAWREVARRIAHEIKNPLTPLQLNAERLRRKYLVQLGEESVFDESTDLIISQVKELRELVDEFRNFAKIPTAKLAPSDLNEIIIDAVRLYKEAHPSIEFDQKLDKTMPIFDFDRDQMKSVVTNLVDNAVAAIEGAGKISIATSFIEPLQIARLEISDTGGGIRPENRDRVFEPDFSTKKGGSGLGLAIVQRVVSDHYGYIRVRDNHPKGTVFVLELPTQLPLIGDETLDRRRKRSGE